MNGTSSAITQQTPAYRVFVQGWTRPQLAEVFEKYGENGQPLSLEKYTDAPGEEGYHTPFLLEARYCHTWLTTIVEDEIQATGLEAVRVVIDPNPDTTPEYEEMEQLERAWYSLVNCIEEAVRTENGLVAPHLLAESGQMLEAWQARATSYQALAERRLEEFRAASQAELRGQNVEAEISTGERMEQRNTATQNMKRLLLKAVYGVNTVPGLGDVAAFVAANGRWPDYD
jgi:predicted metal-dependent hydrolase